MTNPYVPSQSTSDRRVALKSKLMAFGRTLIKPKALAVIIPVAVIHYTGWIALVFMGDVGGVMAASVGAMILGLPLATLFLSWLPIPLPGFIAMPVVVLNSLLWGVAVLCFLRGLRGLAADGSQLDRDES